jgi:hypothetical protein
MCLVQILYQRKWDLYRVPPEVLFVSRKINMSENKAKDTRTSANQDRPQAAQSLNVLYILNIYTEYLINRYNIYLRNNSKNVIKKKCNYIVFFGLLIFILTLKHCF